MDLFFKIFILVMASITVYLLLDKQNKDMAFMMTLCVCCTILVTLVYFLEPVMSFFQYVKELANLDGGHFTILMKITAIGILSEVASQVCQDAGNAAIAKTLDFMTVTVVIWLSLPLFMKLLDLVGTIMGDL